MAPKEMIFMDTSSIQTDAAVFWSQTLTSELNTVASPEMTNRGDFTSIHQVHKNLYDNDLRNSLHRETPLCGGY